MILDTAAAVQEFLNTQYAPYAAYCTTCAVQPARETSVHAVWQSHQAQRVKGSTSQHVLTRFESALERKCHQVMGAAVHRVSLDSHLNLSAGSAVGANASETALDVRHPANSLKRFCYSVSKGAMIDASWNGAAAILQQSSFRGPESDLVPYIS